MNNKHSLSHAASVLSWFAMAGSAWATGGHHAVDDASILDPGQCQLELWSEHSPMHRLAHVGPGCRWGPVEAGVSADRSSDDSEPSRTLWSPQVKWATTLSSQLAAGAVWTLSWQSPSPRRTSQSILLPVTWQPQPSLALHLNLGRDFPRNAYRVVRRGTAIEWQALPQWQALAEWFDDGQQGNRRLGLRHAWNTQVSLDISRAESTGQPRRPWWTLGVNWTFGSPLP
ncbi:hypothetical protein [Piscinibacter terrae]|uniref:Uncharacterized protein n=1 Tax=Piscinibacter terrae TaxID=2496871 RepID=A0A3N7HKJ2_9BURK|nr:hypothetical protein [Albitalea terrae]RQP21516.1 hypothetical protein DZC73_26740 [Albitalea terrae]